MVTTFTQSTIMASKDKHLQDALLSVTKEAVTDALMDDGFMVAFGDAMCKGLMDYNIYRSAAKGVVNSLNPFATRPSSSCSNRTRTTCPSEKSGDEHGEIEAKDVGPESDAEGE